MQHHKRSRHIFKVPFIWLTASLELNHIIHSITEKFFLIEDRVPKHLHKPRLDQYDKKYEVNCGDVLISWSASLGVYVWSGEKSVLNQHIFKVVFDKQTVNKSFFVHQAQNILENGSLDMNSLSNLEF